MKNVASRHGLLLFSALLWLGVLINAAKAQQPWWVCAHDPACPWVQFHCDDGALPPDTAKLLTLYEVLPPGPCSPIGAPPDTMTIFYCCRVATCNGVTHYDYGIDGISFNSALPPGCTPQMVVDQAIALLIADDPAESSICHFPVQQNGTCDTMLRTFDAACWTTNGDGNDFGFTYCSSTNCCIQRWQRCVSSTGIVTVSELSAQATSQTCYTLPPLYGCTYTCY